MFSTIKSMFQKTPEVKEKAHGLAHSNPAHPQSGAAPKTTPDRVPSPMDAR